MLGGYQTTEADFTADRPGLTLFHCHMQLHVDFGFMGLFDGHAFDRGRVQGCARFQREQRSQEQR